MVETIIFSILVWILLGAATLPMFYAMAAWDVGLDKLNDADRKECQDFIHYIAPGVVIAGPFGFVCTFLTRRKQKQFDQFIQGEP